jgi:hypothetical protein
MYASVFRRLQTVSNVARQSLPLAALKLCLIMLLGASRSALPPFRGGVRRPHTNLLVNVAAAMAETDLGSRRLNCRISCLPDDAFS